MLCFLAVLLLLPLIALLFKRFILERIFIDGYEEKAVLITGCDSGFGFDLALRCLSHGMTVFATCLTAEGCQRLLTQSSGLTGQLDCFMMDVRSEESIAKAFNHLKKAINTNSKGLYGLVNNAGVSGAPLPDDLLTLDDYRRVIDVNAFGVIRVTHAFKELIKQQRGRIIVATSVCSRVAMPVLGPYSVSKFAVDAYCDILRRELSVFGVIVCAVEPGFFNTPMVNMDNLKEKLQNIWESSSDELKQQYGKKYLAHLRGYMRGFLRGICSSHTEWVVDAYFHALTSRYPRIRYRVGNDALLWFLPLSYLPSSVTDMFVQIFTLITGAPKPIPPEGSTILRHSA